MEHLPRQALSVLGAWGVALTLLCWPRFEARTRRGLALLASAAGVGFLLAGLGAEGAREVPTVAGFVFGSSYVTEQVSASASLPFYVATGVCLLVGTAGLAVPDEMTDELGRHYVLIAIGYSLGVTGVRFLLEKAAAPPNWTYGVGVTWLPLIVGAFFAAHIRHEGGDRRDLVRDLAIYSVAVRSAVLALMIVATGLQIGSHYDVTRVETIRTWGDRVIELEAGSLTQMLVLGVIPQLVVWPILGVAVGLLGAALGGRFLQRRLWAKEVR